MKRRTFLNIKTEAEARLYDISMIMILPWYMTLATWCSGEESACQWVGKETLEPQVRSLDWEDPLKQEMAVHSSILAWKILWTEESGRLQSMGLQTVRHNLVTEYACIPYQSPRGSYFQCYGLVKALVLNHCLLNNFGSENCNKIQSSFLIHLRLLNFQKVFWNQNSKQKIYRKGIPILWKTW